MAGKSDADTAIPSWENSADKPISIDGKGERSIRLCSWVPEARPGSAAASSRELPSGSVRQSECIMEFCVSRVSRARCTSRRSAFVSRRSACCCCCSTRRAHTPDPIVMPTYQPTTTRSSKPFFYFLILARRQCNKTKLESAPSSTHLCRARMLQTFRSARCHPPSIRKKLL